MRYADAMSQSPPASRMRSASSTIGTEQAPLLLVDNMLSNPEDLLRIAHDAPFTPAFTPAGGYPGLRAAAPRAYTDAMIRTLIGPVREAFGLGPVAVTKAECAFSIVTLPPDRLTPPQRAPHVDSTDGHQFAILHYLSRADHGGTAFYRHRATGFETITDDRKDAFLAIRAQEGWAAGYVADGEPWFEQTAEIDAAFNRVIVYRSNVLHSGRILAPQRLSPDPRLGRLTANIFVTFSPVGDPA
ncbi:DUF6445 family protein [Sphingomonas arantia]|uniref:DUF6445 family protein n=1 Tax=Sphingomonas arantia TaxID=1460676 RepID=A0ABW4TZJ8_9SPHN